jgi:hypothetical protein
VGPTPDYGGLRGHSAADDHDGASCEARSKLYWAVGMRFVPPITPPKKSQSKGNGSASPRCLETAFVACVHWALLCGSDRRIPSRTVCPGTVHGSRIALRPNPDNNSHDALGGAMTRRRRAVGNRPADSRVAPWPRRRVRLVDEFHHESVDAEMVMRATPARA